MQVKTHLTKNIFEQMVENRDHMFQADLQVISPASNAEEIMSVVLSNGFFCQTFYIISGARDTFINQVQKFDVINA